MYHWLGCQKGGKIVAKKWIVVVMVLVLITSGFNICAIADCRSDCENEYESDIKSCKDQNDDPSDAEDLQTCMDDANKEYQSCINDCEGSSQEDDQ